MSEGTTIWWVQAAALLPIPCGMSTKEEVDKDLKPSQTRCCVSQWQAICCSIGCSLAGICVHNLTWIVYTPYLFLPTIQPWWIIFPTFHFETTTCKWKSFAGLASPCSYNKSQESVRVLRSEKILILLPLVTSFVKFGCKINDTCLIWCARTASNLNPHRSKNLSDSSSSSALWAKGHFSAYRQRPGTNRGTRVVCLVHI